MDILFLGATGTVTGSKFLVSSGDCRVLVDCGLFQGYKQLRERNWQPLPIDPATIDAVALTHAHLDHSGWLPVLVRSGFSGPIYCTDATVDLCGVLLRDAAHIQEEEAEYANRRGFTRHRPARPLYTGEDAEAALRQLRSLEYGEDLPVDGGLRLRLTPAGHILGSAFVSVRDARRHVLFTGDLGRPDMPLMGDPSQVAEADYLVVESTYGNRKHEDVDPADQLAEVIGRTLARNGTVLIPSFAVARAQTLLVYLHQLKKARRIPDVPVYLNSPMATNVTELYVRHHDEHRLSLDECREVFQPVRYVRTVEESKKLNERRGPMIIISSSGMATGGRVLHHLRAFGPDARNTILFVGFQAGGTRGRDLVRGADRVRIHGQDIPIRAEVAQIGSLSAHADVEDTLEWLGGFEKPPRQVFLVHGEPSALEGQRRRIRDDLGWPCHVPDYRERVDLASFD